MLNSYKKRYWAFYLSLLPTLILGSLIPFLLAPYTRLHAHSYAEELREQYRFEIAVATVMGTWFALLIVGFGVGMYLSRKLSDSPHQ